MAVDRPADVAGIHACLAVVQSGQASRVLLLAGKLNRRQQELLEAAQAAGVEIERGGATELVVAAPRGLRHQGAVAWRQVQARAATKDLHTLDDLLEQVSNPFVLVLDGVEDPRNLGACLRSADGAGADAVIVPRGRGAPITAVVSKTAAGAAESLPVISVANLAQALDALRDHGVLVIGLADEADAELYAMALTGSLAVVLGNEGQGLRRLTREHCDAIASLPMLGSVSSLNVSVATGVVMYEALRQRRGALPAAT